MKLLRRILQWAFILFFASTIAAVLAYKWLPVPLTPLMLIRCAQQVGRGEMPVLRHKWVPLHDISRHLPVAVIASEDQLFMSHHGFDTKAIAEAAKERMEGKRKRGGSTISQQTAKNVFLWPTSSWVRKGFEVYFTFLIETCWSKERIMEVYLNSIEMGPGIYGAEAVAQRHFGCPAAELSRAECALIAATLPNPLKYSSQHPGPYMRKRQRWIERQMVHIPPFNMGSAGSSENDLPEELKEKAPEVKNGAPKSEKTKPAQENEVSVVEEEEPVEEEEATAPEEAGTGDEDQPMPAWQ